MEERLIIKNFGPIKSIDIPIRKINVVIGDQGSGKSTIAKVLALFKDWSFIVNPQTEYFNLYNLLSHFKPSTEISYTHPEYQIQYIKGNFSIKFFSPDTERIFLSLKEEYEKVISGKEAQDQALYVSLRTAFVAKINSFFYIPAERVGLSVSKNKFTPYPSDSFSQYLNTFYALYSIHQSKTNNLDLPEFGIKYKYENEIETLEIPEGKTIRIPEAATGIQSLLPIFLIVDHQTRFDLVKGVFIIEEPELNLFPLKQNKLVNYLVERISKINDVLFLTTHSPYILTSLNNLLYAYKIGQIHEGNVNTIINKKYWINPSEISAFVLNEKGESEDLMDYEINQINVERIDEVSRQINDDFDKLLKIEFAKK